jgi:hypothetical protein
MFALREQYNVSSIRQLLADASVNDPKITQAMNLWWEKSIYVFYSCELDDGNVPAMCRFTSSEIGTCANGRERDTQ